MPKPVQQVLPLAQFEQDAPQAAEQSTKSSDLKKLEFAYDDALLRELGERLVGKPAFALAELVKNSYDADASRVEITVDADRIEVADNGDGMSFDDFKNFWMRVGTTHKQGQETSDKGRRLTGSKGVGRLSVQFLADQFCLWTGVAGAPHELFAKVDWPSATTQGQAQKCTVHYDERRPAKTTFPEGAGSGTRIVMKRLRGDWDAKNVADLANSLWALQPPFGHETNSRERFTIDFKSPDEALEAAFQKQLGVFRNDVWYAKITGHLRRDAADKNAATAHVQIQFTGEEANTYSYPINPCRIDHVRFEIRVYKANQKQKRNVSAKELQGYLEKWSGVHVYDDGFRLPYYGEKENDWLGIEQDHSHRGARNDLLPSELRVARGMQYLPTVKRLFGAVQVSTSKEREEGKRAGSLDDRLKILITRDRLTDNAALADLRKVVRTSVDYYAMLEAKRAIEEKEKKPTLRDATKSLLDTVDQYRGQIPESAYAEIRRAATKTESAGKSEEGKLASHMGLLGALATAGISALAYEHEVSRQLHKVESMAARMRGFNTKDKQVRNLLDSLAQDADAWVERARATRALFSNLTEQENRERRERLKARATIETVAVQARPLLRGIPLDVSDVDPDLRLPLGRIAEWSALFQNVFFNAANAMLDTDPSERRIAVASRRHGSARQILVEDTGCGVNLDGAAELFEPLVRKLNVSQGRKGLVIGGMGLGLAIVRMIASTLECRVEFAEPEEGYSTAFVLSWSERA